MYGNDTSSCGHKAISASLLLLRGLPEKEPGPREASEPEEEPDEVLRVGIFLVDRERGFFCTVKTYEYIMLNTNRN
jgi:hypothetical protein